MKSIHHHKHVKPHLSAIAYTNLVISLTFRFDLISSLQDALLKMEDQEYVLQENTISVFVLQNFQVLLDISL